MTRTTTILTRPSAASELAETLTIRIAVATDAPALRRLAQLDSAPPPGQVPMLVAAADGELYAALPLNGGRVIANPFRRTEEIVAALAARARQLEGPPRSRRRWRSIPFPRAASAPRT
jgi:hypothetical protein